MKNARMTRRSTVSSEANSVNLTRRETRVRVSRLTALMMVMAAPFVAVEASGSTAYYIMGTSGRMLDVQWGNPAANTPVHIWDFNGGVAQQWELIPASTGSFYIRSAVGTFLDVARADPNPGAPVQTYTFNPGPAQRWYVTPAGDGAYYLQSELGTYLDVQWNGSANATPVWGWAFNGTAAQRWYLSPASTTGAATAPLLADSSSIWPPAGDITPISVCWENPTAADASWRTRVRNAVTRTWQANSGVRFSWSSFACPNAFFDGIRIRISDEGPHTKGVGRFLRGTRGGMVLNLTFQNWAPDCRSNRELCVDTIAIHEFGHALGFHHEHNRTDCAFPCVDGDCSQPCTDSACSALCLDEPQPAAATGDYPLTDCDALSIMNYCFDSGYRNALSEDDIGGIQTLYGSGPRASGTLQTRTFRLPNVPGHCPVGATRGDREFGGGPSVYSSVDLSISADGRSIVAQTTLIMVETKDDNSSTSGMWRDVLWTVEPGKRIVSIDSAKSSSVGFRGGNACGEFLGCNDGGVHSAAPAESGAARLFHIIADTGAEDISHDSDCRCDAQLRGVELNSVTIAVQSI